MDSLFDNSLVKDFTEWEKINNNFTWHNYLNAKADIDLALAFAKLFYPDVIIFDGCFLLKDRFDPEIFESYKSRCDSKTEIEKMVNLYELEDFFFHNSDLGGNYSEKAEKLGEILQIFWGRSFKERFGDKNIVVELFNENDEHFITVYEKRNS